MSTSNVKMVDKRKQKNLRKKKRLKQDANNKQEYNKTVAAEIQKYKAPWLYIQIAHNFPISQALAIKDSL